MIFARFRFSQYDAVSLKSGSDVENDRGAFAFKVKLSR
jgi:hypothetical protein